MQWTDLDTWIVVVGALGAASCALLGNFLVLRRLSMMGDAISHAVLPGLAVAFLVTGNRDSMTMFIGAGVVGVITAVLIQWIHDLGRVDPSASMGVVFTVLFAIGLILIVRGADQVDLDPGCVLYGAIELVPLDTQTLWEHTLWWLSMPGDPPDWLAPVFAIEVPRAVVTLAFIFLIDLLFVLLFYKELKITAFDPQLSTTMGINAIWMHYALVTLVAATTVAAFESVGSILVIAMLIVPGGTARLLTDRLSTMIVFSAVIAVLCAVFGHIAAMTVPVWFGFSGTSTAGMMAVVAGIIFTTAMVMAPRHGVLGKLARQMALSVRIAQEDVLGMLYRIEELSDQSSVTLGSVMIRKALAAGFIKAHVVLWGLVRGGKVKRANAGYWLTPVGRDAARGLVRAHRLWESYLVKHLNLPADHVHTPAMQLEHITDRRMQQQLADRTGRPELDPHRKRIPELPSDTNDD